MARKEDDDKIERITKLLEKGGTMLATHHDCGAPMFRYQGKIVCPVCDFREREPGHEQGFEAHKDKKEDQKIIQPQQTKELKKEIKSENNAETIVQENDSEAIRLMIMKKIQEIASGMEDETDLGRVRDKLECIELGIKIVKILKEKD